MSCCSTGKTLLPTSQVSINIRIKELFGRQSDGPPANGFVGPLTLQFHGEGVFIGPVND